MQTTTIETEISLWDFDIRIQRVKIAQSSHVHTTQVYAFYTKTAKSQRKIKTVKIKKTNNTQHYITQKFRGQILIYIKQR